MSKKQEPKNHKGRKAGIVAFGVTAALYAMLFPLYRIGDFILAGALAFLVGKIISIMGSGLDLTTHNKQDEAQKAKEPEELPLTGDDVADATIAKGQDMLRQIRAENAAIPDEVLSGQMDELDRLCVQIFKTVSEKPQKASQIRKFMNYYLPTTLKMLASYRTMNQRGVSVSDMTEARSTVIRGMGMVLTACQKQLDNLYKDDILDVSTDIDVLEQMLKRDGFTESELGSAISRAAGDAAQAPVTQTPAAQAPAAQAPTMQAPATAAGAQMRATNPPVLRTPDAADDEFVSFYSKDRKDHTQP